MRPLYANPDTLASGGWVLYINGLEVPALSVVVSANGDVPTMNITLSPDPVLNRLGAEDRVEVAVFYVDSSAPDGIPRLRLLCDGYIVGWGRRDRADGASLSFKAVGHQRALTQVDVRLLTNVDEISGAAVDAARGVASATPVQSGVVFPLSLFTQGLLGSERIKRPFDFVYNAVAALCGTQIPANQRSLPLTNFFARHARRVVLQHRFVASPVFDEYVPGKPLFPALQATQDAAAVDVLSRSLLGSIRGRGRLLELVSGVLDATLTELWMPLAAPLVRVSLSTGLCDPMRHAELRRPGPPTTAVPGQADAQYDPLKPLRLMQTLVKPRAPFALPPACNVIFPSMIREWGYDEDYESQPTRTYFDNLTPSQLLQPDGALGDAVVNALTVGYPEEALRALKGRPAGSPRSGENVLIFPEEFFKGPVVNRQPAPTLLYFLQQNKAATTTPSGVGQSPYPLRGGDRRSVGELYAQYVHYMERFARRQGDITLHFNPHILQGFPALLLDRRSTRTDLFCCVQGVTHVLTRSNMSTTVSYTYGRLVTEVMDLLRAEFAGGSAAYAIAPLEPLRAVRDVFQHFEAADAYYRTILYGQDPDHANRKAVCFWPGLLAYAPLPDQTRPESIYITGPNEQFNAAFDEGVFRDRAINTELAELQARAALVEVRVQAAQAAVARVAPTSGGGRETQEAQQELREASEDLAKVQDAIKALVKEQQELRKRLDQAPTKVTHNLDSSRVLVPSAEAAACFTSRTAAMAATWREVATMDEYILFRGSQGESLVPAFGTPRSIGVAYWERLYRVSGLPADAKPPDGATGSSGTPQAVPPDYPRARAVWDELLAAYRENMYRATPPH